MLNASHATQVANLVLSKILIVYHVNHLCRFINNNVYNYVLLGSLDFYRMERTNAYPVTLHVILALTKQRNALLVSLQKFCKLTLLVWKNHVLTAYIFWKSKKMSWNTASTKNVTLIVRLAILLIIVYPAIQDFI